MRPFAGQPRVDDDPRLSVDSAHVMAKSAPFPTRDSTFHDSDIKAG